MERTFSDRLEFRILNKKKKKKKEKPKTSCLHLSFSHKKNIKKHPRKHQKVKGAISSATHMCTDMHADAERVSTDKLKGKKKIWCNTVQAVTHSLTHSLTELYSQVYDKNLSKFLPPLIPAAEEINLSIIKQSSGFHKWTLSLFICSQTNMGKWNSEKFFLWQLEI